MTHDGARVAGRPDDSRCLLCGKSREQVQRLILGAHGAVCPDCVELCGRVLTAERADGAAVREGMAGLAAATHLPDEAPSGKVDLMEHVAELKADLDGLDVHAGALQAIADAVLASIRDGGKLLACGNGGSAADAAHLAEELTGRFYRERGPLPGMCLAIDGTLLTCIANDYGFDEIFARQVATLGQRGDVLVGFTTSGNSENIRRAVIVARERGLVTVLFSGRTGGKSKGLADHEIIVQSLNPSSARIQECHQLLMHVLCEMIETEFLGTA
jgi:D-sedoheptulose 7-phosphate isomerase